MYLLRTITLTAMMGTILTSVGCGPSQPSSIEEALVTIEGQPNELVYLSIDATVVTVEGRSTSVQGSGQYGVQTLDSNGHLSISVDEIIAPKPLHGFTVTLVNLNDAPIKLSVNADGRERVAEVTGKLNYGDIQFGYQQKHEPDSPMAHDPENSVYEAKEYLRKKLDENNKSQQKKPL